MRNGPFMAILRHAALALFLSVPPLPAAEIHPDAGTTSATFLKLDVGSRASGMSGAFTAVADDSTALYWNPAGLAQIPRRELNVSHNESFESIRHDFAGYVMPLGTGALGAALYGLYTPRDIERRAGLNENDPYEPLSPVEGYFQSYDLAAQVSYGRYFARGFALGGSLKAVRQTIDDLSGNAIAADIGALYRYPRLPLTVGLLAQNMGTPLTFIGRSYALPFTLRAGAAYRFDPKVVVDCDLIQPIDNFLFIAAGAEYKPVEKLALRAGYKYRTHGIELDGPSGFSAGMGLTFRLRELDLRLDYAFVPYSMLGNSHRLSLTALFDVPAAVVSVPAAAAEGHHPLTTVGKPALPAEPSSTVPSAEDLSGYAFVPAKLSWKIRSASARTPVYAVKAEAVEGGLRSLEGVMRGPLNGNMKIEFGTFTEGNARSYAFTRNFGSSLQKATVLIRLPLTVKHPLLIMKSKRRMEGKKIAGDKDTADYSFGIDSLDPFTVIDGNHE